MPEIHRPIRFPLREILFRDPMDITFCGLWMEMQFPHAGQGTSSPMRESSASRAFPQCGHVMSNSFCLSSSVLDDEDENPSGLFERMSAVGPIGMSFGTINSRLQAGQVTVVPRQSLSASSACWQCGQVTSISLSFPRPSARRKETSLKSGLFPYPSVRLVGRPSMRTRKEVRAPCARSLLHVPLIRIFLRFDRDDDLQKAIGWFGVLVWRGSPSVRGGVPRDREKSSITGLPGQAVSARTGRGALRPGSRESGQ